MECWKNNKLAKYDPNEARRILEGSLEQRVIAYAELKYGKGKEIAAELCHEDYRKAYKDPIQTLDKICGKLEIVDAEFQSIDDVVKHQPKPSKLKVAAKGTLNLVKKTHIQHWYYPFVGMLPAKYQQKIAEKLGDNPLAYTLSNIIAEIPIMAGTGMYLGGVPGTILGASVAGVISLIRAGWLSEADSIIEGKKIFFPNCSWIIGLPFYATLYSLLAVEAAYKGIKSAGAAVKNGVIDSYSSAQKELEQKNLETVKKISPTPIPETGRLELREEIPLNRIKTGNNKIRVAELYPDAEEVEESNVEEQESKKNYGQL